MTIIPELLDPLEYGFNFGKNEAGEALRNEVNEYILQLKISGALQALQKKWFDCADLSTVVATDYRDLPSERGTVLLVLKQTQASASEESLWTSITSSFERTFLRESRWKLFPQGIGTRRR